MGITAKVTADSVSPEGKRLTTMVWRYPRFIHSEVMTHRIFSRNAASSRAIPVSKMIEQVQNDPAMPVFWGKNQPGMQAKEELPEMYAHAAKGLWLQARDEAVDYALELTQLGLHKQIANRILEPWMWMVTIVTATEWANFYHLRRHPDAQPEIKVLADAAYEAMTKSTPEPLQPEEWHLPYILAGEFAEHGSDYEILRKLSAARCARVSYLNHDGTSPNIEKDLQLHDMLVKASHASPFEHQAKPLQGHHANFWGWQQYRSLIPNENVEQYPGI